MTTRYPRMAFIGPGRVGRSLAFAFKQAGVDVVGYVGRAGSSSPTDNLLDGIPPLQTTEALAKAEWIWLTVPDGQIKAVSDTLPWQPHHVAVHCSGATPLDALSSAGTGGAARGGFHPIQIFSQPTIAAHHLDGTSVGIEIDPNDNPHQASRLAALTDCANQLAVGVGMRPLAIKPGQRALYHAGAGFAASALVSVLAEALDLWASAGIEPAQALTALLPLARTSLLSFESAATGGALDAAVAGPVARGDLGVIESHLTAFDEQGIDPALYCTIALKQVALMARGDRLNAATLAAMEQRLTGSSVGH